MDRATANRIAQGLGWFSIGLGAAEIFAPRHVSRLIGVRHNGKREKILRTYGLREIAAGAAILSVRGSQRAPWLWGRVAGDLMDLSSLGAAYMSRGANRTRVGAATAAVAGVTALDVYCSQQLTEGARDRNIRVRQSIIVDRTPSEVYQFWRNENNWPQFMENVESVHASGDGVRWKVRVPGRREINWETRITNDVPDSLIGWQSTDGSDVDISGTVRFERAPGDRGTLVSLAVQFTPPGGAIGAAVARMFESIPTTALEMCLRKAKQVMETGEVARSDASIFPGMHPAQPPERVPELAFAH